MSRVVPSQVLEIIAQLYAEEARDPSIYSSVRPGHLKAIPDTLDQVPSELFVLSGQDLVDFYVSLSFIRTALDGRHTTLSQYRGMNPVFLLYQALMKCPDEAPSATTASLTFIKDADLRESIRCDISAAQQDAVNGEWKGATVLAGSATEALLLWAVQDEEKLRGAGTLKAAGTHLAASGTLLRAPDSDPERWGLSELIEVALHFSRIAQQTAAQARLGKDFRNLIHPGRAARLGQRCDRATALSALAAVEHVARDLTP
jgi:hypothetical protein